jgi:ABC-type nitrate/sulfonate/bicarbonate transport system substrate-binding protein
VVENGVAARRSFIDKNPSVARRFIRAAFEGIHAIYTDKEQSLRVLAKYTKVSDDKILAESYRFSVEALSKEGFMPPEAFTALLEQMVGQKSVDEAMSKKLPITAYFDNRFVTDLDKEGFFKKLWQ